MELQLQVWLTILAGMCSMTLFVYTDQKELSAGCHVIKGSRVKVEFQQLRVAQEGQMEGDSDGEDDEGPMKLEVADVPATISLESLKCFFELERSGGGSGAVADICSVGTGVFHVTFHDRKGEMI